MSFRALLPCAMVFRVGDDARARKRPRAVSKLPTLPCSIGRFSQRAISVRGITCPLPCACRPAAAALLSLKGRAERGARPIGALPCSYPIHPRHVGEVIPGGD